MAETCGNGWGVYSWHFTKITERPDSISDPSDCSEDNRRLDTLAATNTKPRDASLGLSAEDG